MCVFCTSLESKNSKSYTRETKRQENRREKHTRVCKTNSHITNPNILLLPLLQGFVQVYKHILEAGVRASGHQPFTRILRHLAGGPTSPASSPAPILVHCTAGKDRTGVIVALVLALCGVSDDAVAHEYSLTDLGLQERKEEFIAHLVKTPPLQDDREAAERMVSSRRENMRATLAMIRERWGGVEAFVVNECGLSAEEVARIRENLVVDLAEGEEPVDWEEHMKLMP